MLRRFGDSLNARTLAAVARGPLVKRLQLSEDDDYCTRNEFTLLTLFMQGKVSEADLAQCRSTFDKLDASSNGKLSVQDLEVLRQQRLKDLDARCESRRKLIRWKPSDRY